MPEHTLALTSAGFSCTACHWCWDHLPSSRCPGVTRYHDRAHAPRHLLSAVELLRTDIPKPDAPSACQTSPRHGVHMWLIVLANPGRLGPPPMAVHVICQKVLPICAISYAAAGIQWEVPLSCLKIVQNREKEGYWGVTRTRTRP